jgi:hypothetical protein
MYVTYAVSSLCPGYLIKWIVYGTFFWFSVEYATAQPEQGMALCSSRVQRCQSVESLRAKLTSYLGCAVMLTAPVPRAGASRGKGIVGLVRLGGGGGESSGKSSVFRFLRSGIFIWRQVVFALKLACIKFCLRLISRFFFFATLPKVKYFVLFRMRKKSPEPKIVLPKLTF